MNEATPTPQTTYWDAQPADQPYSIKRHGVSLSNCDAEPVQTPGCVQAHGALLVLRIADLCILQASENTQDLLGRPAAALLGRRVGTVVLDEREARLRSMLANEPTDRNPVYAFTLPPSEQGRALDVTLHTIDGAAVLEFEISGCSASQSTSAPAALTDYRPLAPDYYAIIKKTVARLQLADTLHRYCQVLADEVRALTGMDRVMIYRFHADDHGEVFAESKIDTLAPWLGLHYPAEDIPKPARDIFSRTWIRPVPDIAATLAELVPLQNPDTGKSLDMTHCALRGVSVMYTEYLRNMGVTAGVTMPLRRGNVLWGLIACHHYQGPLGLPYELRAACEFLAQVASLQHQAAEDREHAAYRTRLDEIRAQLVMTAARSGGALNSMAEGVPCLLDAMQAGGAALYDQNRWWRMGATPGDAELDALADWLARRQDTGSGEGALYVTDALAGDYPAGAQFAELASGVLAAPIFRGSRKCLMWFRPELIQTINWGGNPHDKPTVPGPFGPRLTPRRSFELFSETVRQRALPWKQVEIDAARGLRTQLQELVVGSAERLAALNADLARSNEELDSFAYVASHDLKEPLRGIHKYAHQLLDRTETASPDDRHRLEGVMRLTLRMDGLLDSLLHFSRVGREELLLESVDLNLVLADAIEMVGSRTIDGRSEIEVPRALPTLVCNRIRVREVFVNLLSNALKYNDKPARRVEVGTIDADDAVTRENFPAGIKDETVFYVSDNGIGIQPRYFEQVFKIFKRLHARDEYGGGSGVGLTIVRKLVERHRGQVWLESIPGAGCRVFFTLGATALD